MMEARQQFRTLEQSLAEGAGWLPVDWSSMKSDAGAVLAKEPGGALLVSGNAAPKDTYTLSTKTKLKGITAIRIEAIPDPRLPNNGPGRGSDGNFTLSGIKATLAAAEKPAAEKPAAEKPAAEKVAAEKPAVEKPAADKPDGGGTPAEDPRRGAAESAAAQSAGGPGSRDDQPGLPREGSRPAL
jgi:hypothetical protein